jgi:hypothetical protein
VGAELLNLYINAYMRKLIDSIEKAGGDIIKFAGDAMQVVWRVASSSSSSSRDTAAADALDATPDSPSAPSPAARGSASSSVDHASHHMVEGLEEAVLAAARCSLRMLIDLHGFSPVTGVTLKLHIGIGVGQMTGYTVGGHLKKWCALVRRLAPSPRPAPPQYARAPRRTASAAAERQRHGGARAHESAREHAARRGCAPRGARRVPSHGERRRSRRQGVLHRW